MRTCPYHSDFRFTKVTVIFFSECVERKFGKGTMDELSGKIRGKINQKCIDTLHKRIKKEKEDEEKSKKEKNEKGDEGKSKNEENEKEE